MDNALNTINAKRSYSFMAGWGAEVFVSYAIGRIGSRHTGIQTHLVYVWHGVDGALDNVFGVCSSGRNGRGIALMPEGQVTDITCKKCAKKAASLAAEVK